MEIKWPDTEVYYVLTGIGKAKAAYRVAEAINHVQPDLVVNAGTAGTIVHQVGDICLQDICRQRYGKIETWFLFS